MEVLSSPQTINRAQRRTDGHVGGIGWIEPVAKVGRQIESADTPGAKGGRREIDCPQSLPNGTPVGPREVKMAAPS